MIEHYKSTGMYDTGIFGTDIVTRILFERGHGQLAFELLTSEKEIAFSFQIKSTPQPFGSTGRTKNPTVIQCSAPL